MLQSFLKNSFKTQFTPQKNLGNRKLSMVANYILDHLNAYIPSNLLLKQSHILIFIILPSYLSISANEIIVNNLTLVVKKIQLTNTSCIIHQY